MPPPSIANRLLAALAPEDLDALGAQLEPVPLPHKQTLSSPGAPIDHVYFVEEGMVSLIQPLRGGMVEVGMIGKEGFIGVPVLLGADASPQAGRSTALSGLLLRYAQALQVQVSVSAGLIGNTHGRVTIIERNALEAASCECYRIVKSEYERLFAPDRIAVVLPRLASGV
jgi:hypothetical protein